MAARLGRGPPPPGCDEGGFILAVEQVEHTRPGTEVASFAPVQQEQEARRVRVLLLGGQPDRLQHGVAGPCGAVREPVGLLALPQRPIERLDPGRRAAEDERARTSRQRAPEQGRQRLVGAGASQVIEADLGHGGHCIRPATASVERAMAVTLSLYVARQFLLAVLAMLAALAGIVSLFDFIELLRRSATKPDATFALVTQIAGLRVPFVAMQILPFAVLLGGILAFWRLTRSSELIVARAAGVSAWHFLSAPLFCAILLGGIATAGISPLSSVMLARAKMLDNAYLKTASGSTALTGGQLWLRQSDRELDPAGVAILHARGVKMDGDVLIANDVSVFRLDGQDRLLVRLEATTATLQSGA